MISLRPAGEHAVLRRVVTRHGARLFALSPWRVVHLDATSTRRDLDAALDAERVVFTSPAAVAAAAALRPLRARAGQVWLAVGSGSARALRRAGIGEVEAPTRMDSDGLLALPALQSLAGLRVGLVTAPGGRGRIADAVREAGASLRRADVYLREPLTLSPARIAALRGCDGPWLLPLSSGEALQRIDAALPADLRERLRAAQVLAASDRLAALAATLGFRDVRRARDARPASLLAAAMPSTAPIA
ncbi:uroporphyrinogen-III synthase [Luteimonas cellulosilyticus]|uniref:uroporphyrinogen-III synthase n=1 Tax=Luteimonas cellulosilyticus TaxID=2683586 RepID=UPI001F3A181A|nr:uroporphyrinogen-III synthase [Luteimonas cellulosilyticus]